MRFILTAQVLEKLSETHFVSHLMNSGLAVGPFSTLVVASHIFAVEGPSNISLPSKKSQNGLAEQNKQGMGHEDART